MRSRGISISFGILLLCLVTSACSLNECTGENLNTNPEAEEINSFEMRDSSNVVIWRIEAVRPPHTLSNVALGIVPHGFRQTAPIGRTPRKFTKGESIDIVKDTASRWVRHNGVATGTSAFCGGFYESVPKVHRGVSATRPPFLTDP